MLFCVWAGISGPYSGTLYSHENAVQFDCSSCLNIKWQLQACSCNLTALGKVMKDPFAVPSTFICLALTGQRKVNQKLEN